MRWCNPIAPHGVIGEHHRPAWSWLLAASVSACLLATACSSTNGTPVGAPLPPAPPTTATTAPPVPAPPVPSAQAPAATRVPTAASGGLQADFAQLQQSVGGRVGVVIAPVGRAGAPIVLGNLTTGVAWSTSKVPLAIAALRNPGAASLASSVNLAITESDNSAADSLWRSLGGGTTAANKVDAVLREGHDTTTQTQGQVVRPPYSAFGQTQWSLQNQATFTAGLPCLPDSDPVLTMMGKISGSQQWGLGAIPNARFKGGWGPGTTGGYLVRQLGIIDTPGGQVALSIATEPSSGNFSAGAQVLSQVANLLQRHTTELPAGTC